MQQKAAKNGRRGFLLGAGAAGAAGAVAVATQGAVATEPRASAQAPAKAKGYHLTDHIRSYYRSTTV